MHHPDIDADESILSRAALKWNARIILALDERPHRFLELKREMTGASQRMLTRALRSLQRDGLIDRVEVPDTVLHVSYLITDLGRSAAALVRHNNGWIARHLPAIRAAQLRFDAVDE